MTLELPRVLAVVGPTASGKVELGILLAERYGLPICVCDSVKIYRRLDIGSAKPTHDHRRRARHHLVDLVDPDESFSAGDYARAAEQVMAASDRSVHLFVGGTGFYLRSVIERAHGEATDVLARPHTDPERAAFERDWRAREVDQPGVAHSALAAVDPVTASRVHPNNVARLLRALWLCHALGEPMSAVQHRTPPRRHAQLGVLVLDPGRDAVDRAIERRTDRMLAAGWLAEVEKLAQAGYDARLKAMQSIGYKQLLDVVSGRATLPAARDSIITATRQYARRQRTYFRHQLPAERVFHAEHMRDVAWAELDRFVGERS